MKSRNIIFSLFLWSVTLISYGQDTSIYKLRLSLPIIDIPQNYAISYYVPTMQQSLELSNDFYELSFWGIDELGNKIFISKNKSYTKGRKIGNAVFKYGLSLLFSKYGSELPIPLGVWAHEEFHRSVLSVENISSKNGNWFMNRWDGTVYGISDESLTFAKIDNLSNLLYSYVGGIQYEIALNQKIVIMDFYNERTFHKNALLLYNAYYVYDYFKFSTSSISDSVKVIAPPHENTNPSERDYAGADLTAWAYDMFNPDLPFTSRDSFPNGDGVNRRVGYYSDLSPDAQSYLKTQKSLSLLNFINPAIFFVNRIKLNNNLSFNFFTQYAPTHFGNAIAIYLPFKYKHFDFLLDLHNYANKTENGFGIGGGLYNFNLSEKIESDISVNLWNQPRTFFDNKKVFGGQLSIAAKYNFMENFAGFISFSGKTKGWAIANPYLEENISIQFGLNYNLKK